MLPPNILEIPNLKPDKEKDAQEAEGSVPRLITTEKRLMVIYTLYYYTTTRKRVAYDFKVNEFQRKIL